MLHVPADPCWQRPILVILIQGGEIPPLRVAARDFCDAGFEVDAEPFPKKQIERNANRRSVFAQAWPKSTRREKEGEEAGLKQHAIGLIAREISCRTHKGKKTHKANGEHSAWPNVEDEQYSCRH